MRQQIDQFRENRQHERRETDVAVRLLVTLRTMDFAVDWVAV
jgi:hypothetical protein